MQLLTGTADNPFCGDTIQVFISIDEGKITDAQWEGYGCDVCLQNADVLLEALIGNPVDEVDALLEDTTRKVQSDESIGRTREKCALLSLDAVKSVLASQASGEK